MNPKQQLRMVGGRKNYLLLFMNSRMYDSCSALVIHFESYTSIILSSCAVPWMEEGEGNVGNGFLASWSWGMDSGRIYWSWASPRRYGLS